MSSFEVAARFAAPADAVWSFVSWAGMPRLTEGGFFTSADFPLGTEIRPGALRRCTVPDGSAFVERLETYSETDRRYTYSLVDTGPFPVTDYRGIVAVTPAGDGCCLKFGHSATLIDVSEPEWKAIWLGVEHQVFDFIRGRLF